jgi:ABC-2 type transport system permease protein
MTALEAMIRRQLGESRWVLGCSVLALVFIGWLCVYATARIERQLEEQLKEPEKDPSGMMRRMAFLRGMGGPSMDFSSTAVAVMFWNHPFIILPLAAWAIGRAAGAVAGEIERGTLDLTLSRPVAREAYLACQAVVALAGLALLAVALVGGMQIATLYYKLQTPPRLLALARPALNLVALGAAIYGYTLLLSAFDSVRWRPTLITSVLTLAGFIAHVVANIPGLDDWKWLDHLSIFDAYDPVEAAIQGQTLAFNAGVLSGLGAAGIVLALWAFHGRDLPANS